MRPIVLAVLVLTLLPLLPSRAAFDGITLSTLPLHPRPGEVVTVHATVVGGATDSMLVWTTDGDEVARGIGLVAVTLRAPQAGAQAEVRATVLRQSGAGATGMLTLEPSEVTIEWEGDGLVPPHYWGRPLLTGHGSVHAIAIPSDSSTLYTWSVNGTPLQKQSGYGRSSITVPTPFYNTAFVIGVVATSRDKSLHAEDRVVVSPRAADLVTYETSPLSGIADNTAIFGVYSFTTSEVSFIAYPLHVPASDQGTVTWAIGGDPIDLDTGDPRLAVFKKTGAGSGEYSIGVNYKGGGFLDRMGTQFILSF